MKKKLRQAFENATPDVLEVLPEMQKQPAKPYKKKMSDRTKEFIATAASVALLIGVGGGMIVYFAAGGGGYTSTDPSTYTEPTGTHNSDPGFTEPTTTDFERQLMAQAVAMVKPGSDPSQMNVASAPQSNGVLISVSHEGVIYHFYYDTYGALQNIVIPDPDNHEISQNVASEIAMLRYRDFLKNEGGTLEQIACTKNTDHQKAYQVELRYTWKTFGASSFTVYVDACTGRILEQYGVPAMELGLYDAKNIAFLEAHTTKDQVSNLLIEVEEYDNHPGYMVSYCVDDKDYTVFVDGNDGSILYTNIMDSSTADKSGFIGWAAARDICLARQGIQSHDLFHFSWTLAPNAQGEYYYTVFFNNDPNLAGPGYIMAVRATDGAVLTAGDSFTQPIITANQLQDLVFDHLQLPADVVNRILSGVYGSIEYALSYANDRLFYVVSVDTPYWLCDMRVHAYSGEVLSSHRGLKDVLSESTVIELALKSVGVPPEEALNLTCLFTSDTSNVPENSYYTVSFDRDGFRHIILIQAHSGELLDFTAEKLPTPNPDEAWLREFNLLFGNWRNYYSQALLCTFDDPSEISLKTLFYRGFAGQSQDPTDEEWALLKDQPGFEEGFDLIRLPKEKMEQVLAEVFGVSLNYIADTGFDGLVYLEETGCYYHQVSDVEALTGFNAVSAEVQEDGTIRVSYTADSLEGIHTVTLMPDVDGAYMILSNH